MANVFFLLCSYLLSSFILYLCAFVFYNLLTRFFRCSLCICEFNFRPKFDDLVHSEMILKLPCLCTGTFSITLWRSYCMQECLCRLILSLVHQVLYAFVIVHCYAFFLSFNTFLLSRWFSCLFIFFVFCYLLARLRFYLFSCYKFACLISISFLWSIWECVLIFRWFSSYHALEPVWFHYDEVYTMMTVCVALFWFFVTCYFHG
jgi:hypothetical protein